MNNRIEKNYLFTIIIPLKAEYAFSSRETFLQPLLPVAYKENSYKILKSGEMEHRKQLVQWRGEDKENCKKYFIIPRTGRKHNPACSSDALNYST